MCASSSGLRLDLKAFITKISCCKNLDVVKLLHAYPLLLEPLRKSGCCTWGPWTSAATRQNALEGKNVLGFQNSICIINVVAPSHYS